MNIPLKKLLVLTIVAFIIRATVFSSYVQHELRYCQPDTPDYHISGISLSLGKGMQRYGTPFPFFWRAPGYPWYLSHFFKAYGVTNLSLEANQATHKTALWVQIAIASFIPLLLFILAFMLTSSSALAWLVAGITTVHPGFVLASMFLLTEGIALVFFFLFLIFFYASFNALGERPLPPHARWVLSSIMAGTMLALTTWMRPMGEYLATVITIIILLFAQATRMRKLKTILLMLIPFFLVLSPWYMRNYALTHKIFFCPMMGSYLNAFIAPRVLRDVQNRPLEDTFQELQKKGGEEIRKEYVQNYGSRLSIVPEQIPLKIALPIIMAHPWYAAYEWMGEVIKSTFDLYSWQLVALVKKIFRSDPLEEFLGEKTAICLYRGEMPWLVRVIAWLELLYALALWIGLFFGIWYFLLRTLIKKFMVNVTLKALGGLWLKTGFVIGSLLFMTGGFGYARLRLPVEPLLIILSLSAWQFMLNGPRKQKTSLQGKSL